MTDPLTIYNGIALTVKGAGFLGLIICAVVITYKSIKGDK